MPHLRESSVILLLDYVVTRCTNQRLTFTCRSNHKHSRRTMGGDLWPQQTGVKWGGMFSFVRGRYLDLLQRLLNSKRGWEQKSVQWLHQEKADRRAPWKHKTCQRKQETPLVKSPISLIVNSQGQFFFFKESGRIWTQQVSTEGIEMKDTIHQTKQHTRFNCQEFSPLSNFQIPSPWL